MESEVDHPSSSSDVRISGKSCETSAAVGVVDCCIVQCYTVVGSPAVEIVEDLAFPAYMASEDTCIVQEWVRRSSCRNFADTGNPAHFLLEVSQSCHSLGIDQFWEHQLIQRKEEMESASGSWIQR